MSMKSKYNSFCVKCRDKIRKGDWIEKDDERNKWVHVDCEQSKIDHENDDNGVTGRNVPVHINSPDHLKSLASDKPSGARKKFVPSKYQQAIFAFITDGEGNAVVEAVAGSGKTTTIVEALEIIPEPENKRIGMLAFNNAIVRELEPRVPEYVHVSTIHSLGFKICRKLEELDPREPLDNDKVGHLMSRWYPIAKSDVERLGLDQHARTINRIKRNQLRSIVALSKATLVNHNNTAKVMEMMEHYGIDDDENTQDVLSHLSELMQLCIDNTDHIDFNDMIWLPVVHPRLKNHFEKFDYLFIDEAQDLNKCQMEFVLNSLTHNGRIIAVGDRKQSLYGFRGADTEAIPRLITSLNASTLPLSISYRCPSSHIANAKKIVPQIEASDTAIEGTWQNIAYTQFLKEVNPSDMVICRTNAPLVKPAFECIKAGKKAIIRGKDIGKQLVNFVERFEATNLSTLEILMSEYTEKEYDRLIDKDKELQAEMLIDKTDTIKTVAKECTKVSELIQKLQMLFSDSNVGVVFSSIHRAKGLEAERVFILHSELLPHPKAKQDWEMVQEDNAKYVAFTRSKRDMFIVLDRRD